MTQFILVKNNLTCKTRNLDVVEQLQALGWKVEQNELSTLI